MNNIMEDRIIELRFTIKGSNDTICVKVNDSSVVFGINYLVVPKNMERLTSKMAINPITKLEIPIFSDEISECKAGFPAYDKNDYKFALKHKLDINRVMPILENEYPKKNKKWIYKQNIVLFVKHYKLDKYLYINYNDGLNSFIDGDSENGETHLETAFRLLAEQSGYVDIKQVDERPLKFIYVYYDKEKDVNLYIEEIFMDIKLKSDKCIEMAKNQKFNQVVKWANKKELKELLCDEREIMNDLLMSCFDANLKDKVNLKEKKN